MNRRPINHTTRRRMANPNLVPASRCSWNQKVGKPWRDSRGRWYVRDVHGGVRRCDPPEAKSE